MIERSGNPFDTFEPNGRHDADGYHTHHVGIYLGNDNMIDAYQTGTYIEIDTISKASDLVG